MNQISKKKIRVKKQKKFRRKLDSLENEFYQKYQSKYEKSQKND